MILNSLAAQLYVQVKSRWNLTDIIADPRFDINHIIYNLLLITTNSVHICSYLHISPSLCMVAACGLHRAPSTSSHVNMHISLPKVSLMLLSTTNLLWLSNWFDRPRYLIIEDHLISYYFIIICKYLFLLIFVRSKNIFPIRLLLNQSSNLHTCIVCFLWRPWDTMFLVV
jgi:hypothetical protein